MTGYLSWKDKLLCGSVTFLFEFYKFNHVVLLNYFAISVSWSVCSMSIQIVRDHLSASFGEQLSSKTLFFLLMSLVGETRPDCTCFGQPVGRPQGSNSRHFVRKKKLWNGNAFLCILFLTMTQGLTASLILLGWNLSLQCRHIDELGNITYEVIVSLSEQRN